MQDTACKYPRSFMNRFGFHTHQDEEKTFLSEKAEFVDHETIEPSPVIEPQSTTPWCFPRRRTYDVHHLIVSFIAGCLVCGLMQLSVLTFSENDNTQFLAIARGIPGSTEIDSFPIVSATEYTELFPTSVGFGGTTRTGAEAAIAATAPEYPLHTAIAGSSLVGPKKHDKDDKFDIFKYWGNLSPWYSNKKDEFGLDDSSPEPPKSCQITGLHLLHRHGARYPSAKASYGNPPQFAQRLSQARRKWRAKGHLSFLNDWTYKLGEEILTPFGRQQLYDLGVSMRMKYGFLLNDFVNNNEVPVFRTESQDRMLSSATNFALGFFGWPADGQYYQSVTIEAPGFNNSLSPYKTCTNTEKTTKNSRASYYVERWVPKYLKHARKRLQKDLRGYILSYEDVYAFQQLCAYETVALGYSKFCELFTEKEWKGFEYSWDLHFWYNYAFGSPLARVQGVGYANELIARLTHRPIPIHNTSTNGTLDDNEITFPLNHNFYVDATHEVVIFNILTALNLTYLARSGPLPADHIPKHRSFVASQLAPFAGNVQFQLLSCSHHPEEQIRIVINDAVVPLTGIEGCHKQKDGMCPLSTFVSSQQLLAEETDWDWGCYGDWEVEEGPNWITTTGDPPRKWY